MDNLLIVFLKNPILGRVKTRLAKDIGNENALQVYLRLLDINLQCISKFNGKVHLYFDSFLPENNSYPEHFKLMIQEGNDLGERMSNAFQNSFEKGFKKCIIIGSDCPAIEPKHLEKSLTNLDTTDVVFGPAIDGGYYLLGMNKYYPELFKNVEWSSEKVLDQSISICINKNLKHHLLEPLRDIDTKDDLDFYFEKFFN